MDNFFKNCPAVMSDGRHFTDYKTSSRRNEYVKYINNIVRDDEYRIFLQQNSESILDKEWSNYRKTMACKETECIHKYPTRTLPQLFGQERMAYDSQFNRNRPHQNNTCQNFQDYRLTTVYQNDGDSFQPNQTSSEIKPKDK